jgi:protein-tyrosine phosphatase
VARLLDFTPHTHTREVPDPYFTDGFEGVYELVRDGATGLLAAIRREHSL